MLIWRQSDVEFDCATFASCRSTICLVLYCNGHAGDDLRRVARGYAARCDYTVGRGDHYVASTANRPIPDICASQANAGHDRRFRSGPRTLCRRLAEQAHDLFVLLGGATETRARTWRVVV